jgi:hypothetical protein
MISTGGAGGSAGSAGIAGGASGDGWCERRGRCERCERRRAGGAGGASGGSGGATQACSEMPVRTGPPAGKEAWRTDPLDTRFPFEGHWMGVFSSNPIRIGDVSLADFDHDGDLDFASGQRQDTPGGGEMLWWELLRA